MQCYLRFECYTDFSRQRYTQVFPDVAVNEPPQYNYGQAVSIGFDEDDPADWSTYFVAYAPWVKAIEHPSRPEETALLFQVFLATEEQWPQFAFPNELSQRDAS